MVLIGGQAVKITKTLLRVTGYYTVAIPPPKLSAGIRPFELKKEKKYNIFTFNPSRMEIPFLTDPGYFIHPLEVRICFCTFVLVVFGTSTLYFSSLWRSPLSYTPPSTPSNVFEINKTIGGGGGGGGLNRGFTVF